MLEPSLRSGPAFSEGSTYLLSHAASPYLVFRAVRYSLDSRVSLGLGASHGYRTACAFDAVTSRLSTPYPKRPKDRDGDSVG